LGTLIYTGLEFLTFFETPQGCNGWNIIFGINPALYMIFVFMQVGIAGQFNKKQQLIISAVLFSTSKYVPKFQAHIFIEMSFLDVLHLQSFKTECEQK